MSQTIPHVITNLLDDKQLHIPKDTKLTIIADTETRKAKPSFYMVGSGKEGIYESYDLLNTLMNLSNPEKWLFKQLLNTHNRKTGMSTLGKLTPSESVKASRAYKLLNQRNLVKKVKRQVYMINPSGLITSNWYQHKKEWDSI